MVTALTQPFDRQRAVDDTRQDTATANPLHADVSPQPIKTPREVQAGLAFLVSRYLARAVTKSVTDSGSPSYVREWSGANWLRNILFENSHLKKINKLMHDFTPHATEVFPEGHANLSGEQIVKRLEKHDKGVALIGDMKKLLARWDGGELTHNTIEYFFKEPHKGGISRASRARIKSKMSDLLFEISYDTIFGIGSLLYTNSMRSGIRKDIHNLYAEAVGFELGTDPKQLTMQDIRSSSNEIIQSTIENYDRKRKIRYAITALPFLRWVPAVRAIQWGELAIGGWGLMWAADVWGREPTMLENFRSFVNNKLNPLYGIGDPIKSADIIDLYQQYSYRFHPEMAFKSISVNDEDANRMWAKSEKLFARIADLMNESYNFKHTTELDPKTNLPRVKADFTLPKFIYLMGNGLLNARRPEWSMAFVELANKYPTMDAVKDAARAMRQNGNLAEVLEKYGIEINTANFLRNGNANGHTNHAAAPTPDPLTAPSTHIHTAALKAEPLSHTAPLAEVSRASA